jgi:cytochrome c-type biogenesis protein CcmH
VTRRVVLVALVLATWWPAVAEACPRTTVADLEDEVMCPVCGTSLGLAREAPPAQRERAFIARLVDRCQGKRQIKAALVAQFGSDVLALPPDRGFDGSAYVMPLAGGLAALAASVLLLGRWRRRAPGDEPPSPPRIGDADRRRLEAELDRLR